MEVKDMTLTMFDQPLSAPLVIKCMDLSKVLLFPLSASQYLSMARVDYATFIRDYFENYEIHIYLLSSWESSPLSSV